MDDEAQARTLMLTTDVPASELTTDGVLAGAKRSQRRWRWAKTTLATVAAVAVALPAATLVARDWADRTNGADRSNGADRTDDGPAPAFAASASAVARDGAPGAPDDVTCPFVPLTRTSPTDYGGIFDVDAAGEVVVGASQGGIALTLWRRERPTAITIAGRTSTLTAVAVNSAGTVAGWDQTAPPYNWVHRDGVTVALPTPAGYPGAVVVALSERGDAVGSLDGRAGLVVWPADARDRPQVTARAGLEPLAIRGDGTVIAFQRNGEPGIVIIKPGEEPVFQPAPVGVDPDAPGFVRGDLFFTSTPQSHPVRWNFVTGKVEVFDRISGTVPAGNAAGWFVVQTTGHATVVVSPDGAAATRPVTGSVDWISSGGGNLIGTLAGGGPGTWRCG